MVDSILKKFEENYAHDLIIAIYGDDSKLYAEDFFVTDRMLHKYHNHIVRNLSHIKGKNILSIGSHTGWLEVLALLNGAESVTCIEPRKKFAEGLKKFTDQHQLKISTICDYHTAVFEIGKKFDTIFAFNSIGMSYDWITYFGRLKTIANKLIFVKGLSNELPEDTCKIVRKHNNHHWGGLNIYSTKPQYQNEYNTETTIDDYISDTRKNSVNFLIGKGFIENLCLSFGYKILETWEDKEKKLSPGSSFIEESKFYRGDRYFVIDMDTNA